jgi:prophage regulatory protein
MKHTEQIPDRSLRAPEVQQLVAYSQQHIDRLEKAGLFPKRIKLGVGRVVWLEKEVRQWLASKREAPGAD